MKSREQLRMYVTVAGMVLALSSVASQAKADEIVYYFSGTINNVTETGSTPPGGPYAISNGEIFTGTFSYNSSSPVTYPETNFNQFTDQTARISVTIGGTTFGQSFLGGYGGPVFSYQDVYYDDPNGNGYSSDFDIFEQASSDVNGIDAVTNIGAGFSNFTSSPLGYLPSSSLPTTLSLSELPDASLAVQSYIYNLSTSSYSSEFFIDGTITSLSLTPTIVPEPSSVVMAGLAIGLAGVRCWTRRQRSPRV